MSQDTIIFFLAAVIAVLSFVVLYQRFIFRKGIQKKIGDMGDTLEQILDEKSDEKVMVFTDDKALIHLSSQINRLLDDRQISGGPRSLRKICSPTFPMTSGHL